MNFIHLIAQITFFPPVMLSSIGYSTISIPLTANAEIGFCFSHQARNHRQPCQSLYRFSHRRDCLFTLCDFPHCGWAKPQVALRRIYLAGRISFLRYFLGRKRRNRKVTTTVWIFLGKCVCSYNKSRGRGSPLNN